MSVFRDLTGQRFGRLVMASRVGAHTHDVDWQCLCDCGGKVIVRAGNLCSGRTKSCGCLAKEHSERILQDLTGQRFGRLRVLRRAENDKSGGARFLCVCDCGNETVSAGTDLRRGRSKSCGCLGRRHLALGRIPGLRRRPGRRRPSQDLTNHKFGRLTVTGRSGDKKHGDAQWLCVCICGTEAIVWASNLRAGHTKSCGCLKRESLNRRAHGHTQKHRATTEYVCWRSMLQRCYYRGHKSFKYYGGKGIAVCSRWLHGEGGKSGFECFLQDMGPKPAHELTIERRDWKGNYEPSNCYWASWETQANNRSDNLLVTIGGITQTVAQWGRQKGINHTTITWRLSRGWPPESLLAPPGPTSGHRITIGGVTKNLSEWGRQEGLGESAIRLRMKRGWPVEALLLPSGSRLKSKSGGECR
jgi:hypothetical protein